MRHRSAGRLAFALAALWAGHAGAAPRVTPSGLPVPRYVSLKFDTVNARGGPGDDYKLLWVYRAWGLPLQVVAETKEWRRVCDPSGGLAWVKSTGVDSRRTVMRTQPGAVPLLARPQPSASVKVYLASRAVATLLKCQAGWCQVRTSGRSGWAPASALWGADDRLQCH